jgi:RNA polymerase sigma factor (sigma-70 family)
MLHHNRDFIGGLEADRRAAAARRRPPADAGEVERLLLAAAAGDGGAWSSLVRRFAARVRAVAQAHRLTAHDVEDVVQDTWLQLFMYVDRVREPDALGAWLQTTARRESLRVLRARQRECPMDSEQLGDKPIAPVDEQHLVAAERRAALAVAMEQLTGREQRLLSMLFAESAPSYETISGSLGLPIGSIGPTRGRALARLRRDRDLVSAVGENADRARQARCS